MAHLAGNIECLVLITIEVGPEMYGLFFRLGVWRCSLYDVQAYFVLPARLSQFLFLFLLNGQQTDGFLSLDESSGLAGGCEKRSLTDVNMEAKRQLIMAFRNWDQRASFFPERPNDRG